MATTRHQGRWSLQDRFASVVQYLPVDIPPGASGLRAELEYDRTVGTLDLGCIGPAGFRGWSGGARRSFTITAEQATPGYLPGELEPGTWQVMVGLYQMPVEGIGYSLTAEVSGGAGSPLAIEPRPAPLPPLAQRPPRRRIPATAGYRWLAGDLHTHTVHSDGAMTVSELARFAVSQGLDYLAITDHNTISHHAELPAAAAAHQIILVPGQEVTTASGHAGALGDLGWIDFRKTADSWLESAERRGGLLSVNHPIGGHVSWTIPMTRRPPLIEVWHWSWLDLRWTNSLSWWLAWDARRDPGRWQRLAPARCRRCPGLAHDVDRGGLRGAAGAAGWSPGWPDRHLGYPGRPGPGPGRWRTRRRRCRRHHPSRAGRPVRPGPRCAGPL